MLTFLLGYSFSALFEESVYKLFKNECSYRSLTTSARYLTYPEASVGWLYQEYIKLKYDLTGAKKFTLEHEFRYIILTQIILIWKYFCTYMHILSILEFGTFLVLFGVYFSIIIKLYSPKLKVIERITADNYLKWFSLGLRWIKVKLVKIRYLPLNEKIFRSVLLFLFKYLFLKTYFWLDFFVFFRFFFIITFFFIIMLSIFLLYYLIYIYLLYNFSKNLALIIKLVSKKLLICFLLALAIIGLIVVDFDVPIIDNENFFKEVFFKVIFFLVQVS
jgi:hypothetical protein